MGSGTFLIHQEKWCELYLIPHSNKSIGNVFINMQYLHTRLLNKYHSIVGFNLFAVTIEEIHTNRSIGIDNLPCAIGKCYDLRSIFINNHCLKMAYSQIQRMYVHTYIHMYTHITWFPSCPSILRLHLRTNVINYCCHIKVEFVLPIK